MRGFFGIGAEGINKQMNTGSLLRTAHAFGANFAFTVAADYSRKAGKNADTSDSTRALPFYEFPDAQAMLLPKHCQVVGVELLEDAVDLPVFRHPLNAVYVLGRERGSLSPGMQARCDFVVRIPMRFCVNLAVAGAIVMYDRLISFGRFPARAAKPGEVPEKQPHVFGSPKIRTPERQDFLAALAEFQADPEKL